MSVTKDFDDLEAKWQKTFGTPKTKSSIRTIPLLPKITALLKDIKHKQMEQRLKIGTAYENNDLVFATQLGRPLDPRDMRRRFLRIIEKAGIDDLHAHSLRHTFASRGLENGIELKVMQELLGHSSIQMTADLYTHVLPDKKKDSIMKLKDTLSF